MLDYRSKDNLWTWSSTAAREPSFLTSYSVADMLVNDSKLKDIDFDPKDPSGITAVSILLSIENNLLARGIRPTSEKSIYRRVWPSKSVRADGSNDATVQLTISNDNRQASKEIAVSSSHCISREKDVDNVSRTILCRQSTPKGARHSRSEGLVIVSGYADPALIRRMAKAEADRTADKADEIYTTTVEKAKQFEQEVKADADAYDKQIRQKAQEDSNAIIEDANTRANQIIFSAQQQSQKLVDDNEITRRAQAYAVETRERAEKDADSIYNQACAQVDKMLSGAAAALSRSASELAALRDSLLTQGSARQQDR